MLELVPLLKLAHVAAAVVSGAGFALRGVWMLARSPHLDARWVRIAPHVVDTLLLLSGITLAVTLRLSPDEQPWLATKIGVLIVYIVLGMLALRRGRTRQVRIAALLGALASYALIVASAVSHRPFGLG